MPGRQPLGEARLDGGVPVEVGAHRHHDPRGVVDERRQERLGIGGGEQLLELVDGDQVGVLHRLQGGQRVIARAQQRDPPMLRARQRAARQRGEQPGPQQRGLARPRCAEDADQAPLGEPRDELGDEPFAPEEHVGVADVEGRQALERTGDDRAQRDRPHPLDGRLLQEDRALELLQRTTGLQPQFLAQKATRGLVGGERVGLAPGPVERRHQLPPQALLERVPRDQRLQLADQLLPGAEFQVGVDAVADRVQPQFLQPPDLGLGEFEGGEIGQRPAAPQRERLAQDLGGPLGLELTAERASRSNSSASSHAGVTT